MTAAPRAVRSGKRCVAALGALALSTWAPLACLADPTSVSDGVFHVTPVRPVAELLPAALAATPPSESGDFRPADLVELIALDPTIRLDIRYASTRNFLGTPLYSQARAFLQRPAAQALVRVERSLAAEGYGLAVHDAYRPWYVTRIFWDATPPELHRFVADPAQGSRHNRGCAVDLTLYSLKSGREVEMPSLYDETTERAYPTYGGGTTDQRRMRDLLRRHMEAEGFEVYEFEWWHFDYRDWKSYRIENVRFEDLGATH
jgi:D-alanyl-D-alanine dipeptidase